MIDQIKAAIGALFIALLAFVSYQIYDAGKVAGIESESKKTVAVQKDFDEYKASMASQLAKAKAQAAAVKIEQEKKYAKAQADYRTDTGILGERLRDIGGLLCGETEATVRVDGSPTRAMPTEAASPARIVEVLKAPASARPTFKYADALEDTAQCSALIQFVKGM